MGARLPVVLTGGLALVAGPLAVPALAGLEFRLYSNGRPLADGPTATHAFTYKFDGRYGRLDYAFAFPSLVDQVADAEVWQVNSRAPVGYPYDNDPVDSSAQASSDHDPVVVSLTEGAIGRGAGLGR